MVAIIARAAAGAARGGGRGLRREGLSHANSSVLEKFKPLNGNSEIKPSSFNPVKEMKEYREKMGNKSEKLQKREGDRSGFSSKPERKADFDVTRSFYAKKGDTSTDTGERGTKRSRETGDSNETGERPKETPHVISETSGKPEKPSASDYAQQLESKKLESKKSESKKPHKLTKNREDTERNDKKLKKWRDMLLQRDPNYKNNDQRSLRWSIAMQGFVSGAQNALSGMGPHVE